MRFGDYYLLHGATAHRVSGGVELRMVWECILTQPPGFKLWVQGLEADSAPDGLWTVEVRPKLPPGAILRGWVWEQRAFVTDEQFEAAPQIILAAWNKEERGLLRVIGPAPGHPYRLRVLPPRPLPGD